MVVDLPRRWRWAIVAGCGFAVVLAVLFVILARRLEAAPAVGATAVPRAASESAPAESSLPEPAEQEAAGERGVDEIQVCGGAWVKTNPDGSLDEAGFERATQLPQTRERILSNLRNSDSEFARATALLLATIGSDQQRRSAILGNSPNCDGTDCGLSPEAMAETLRARDALARMATSTTDPRVYALAFKACGGQSRSDGACQLLSAERWAQIDPGNAAPWMFILSTATARKDRAAHDEALYQIATAQRSRSDFFAAAGAVLDAAGDDDASQWATWTVAVEAIGKEAAFAWPGLQPLVAACRGDALRDANRVQTCAGIADVLTAHSDALLDRGIGTRIGMQVGWPAERVDQMRGELSAYTVGTSPAANDPGDFGCARVHRDLDRFRQLANLGEAGALREWVAQSGRKPEDFINEERARQQLRQERERAAAASAAASGAGPLSVR